MKNLLILACACLFTGVVHTTSAEPVQIEQILKTNKSWNGAALPGFNNGQSEMKVFRYKIAPGEQTPVHLHPMNAAGYMISGELTMFSTDDPHGSFADSKQVKEIKLGAGSAWTETVNTWHYGVNKGDKDAEFVLIFAGQEDVPATLTLGTFVKSGK